MKRGLRLLYLQPKLNGIRALWYHHDGLYTRGGNRITSVPHIIARLKSFFPSTDLDGELYHSTMPFNDINGASRRIEPISNSLKLEYHVFDQPIAGITQRHRLSSIKGRLTELTNANSFLKEVPFFQTTPNHLDYALRLYLAKGFEGMIVRNPDSYYKEGRHVGNLWAIKPVYETEAKFMCFIEGETELHANTFGSMLLKLPNGRTFSCSGITEDERVNLYLNPPTGQQITIKFGAWSHEDRDKAIPLYPRFKAIRWDK
jgi:ATP-dependent DNA ligase